MKVVQPVVVQNVDDGAIEIMDDEETMGSNELDPSKEYYSLLNSKIGRVVLDEAHKIRNPQTKVAEAVRQLKPKGPQSGLAEMIIHLVTATPMMNRGADFVGYLSMFWCDELDVDVAESYGDFEFDPYDETHVPEHTEIYQTGGELDFDRYQLPLWRLNPSTFAAAMNTKDAEGRCLNAYKTLRAVIPIIMLRRTQASVLEVNGEWVRIGDSIPPYRICTVELKWDNAVQFVEYNRLFQGYIEYLTSGQAPSKRERVFMVPGFGKGKRGVRGNAGTRSFGIYRILTIMTFNLGLHTMLMRTGRRNLVADVHQWYDKFADKGMSYYFDLTKPDRTLPLYADRFSMALYLCKDSPKLKYLAKLMGEICLDEKNPRRTIIFSDGPMALWNIEGFLSVCAQTIVSPPPHLLPCLVRRVY